MNWILMPPVSFALVTAGRLLPSLAAATSVAPIVEIRFPSTASRAEKHRWRAPLGVNWQARRQRNKKAAGQIGP